MSPLWVNCPVPLAWPSDILVDVIDEPVNGTIQVEKPDPKNKDGGINYVW